MFEIEWLSSATFQMWVVALLTVLLLTGFIRERHPPDVLALLAMAILVATGLVTVPEALSVFSNPAPVTIAAMFILSAALERTGAIDFIGRSVIHAAEKHSPVVAITAMFGTIILLSAFVNNTPVVVIFIPVAISLARSLGIASSKLLIPVSFAAIFGGTLTLIGTSTNIVVDGAAQKAGLPPFSIFEITAAGSLMALVGCVYMATVSRYLLPNRQSLTDLLPSQGERRFFTQVVIPQNSSLIGKKLSSSPFSVAGEALRVIDVFRDNLSQRRDLQTLALDAGDRVILRASVSEILTLKAAGDVAIRHDADAQSQFETLSTRETRVMEGVIGPNSLLAGRAYANHGLARLYGVYVLATHRRGENISIKPENFRFEIGDTLLLEGPVSGLRRLFDDGALNSLTELSETAVKRPKAPIAIASIVGVVVLASFGIMPIAALALLAAIGVIVLGCIDHQDAYKSVRWDIIMLICGMLTLGIAMEKTGTAEAVVKIIFAHVGQFGPLFMLFLIFLVTSILTEIMSNTATAIIMTPIAVSLGPQYGIDPRAFVVAVMFAASASFATPIGYQTNTLVYSAGGYRFADFVKVGLPLNILMLIAAMIIIPVFWPLATS